MTDFEGIPQRAEQAAEKTIGAAIKVHRALGPGLLESVYQTCLIHELQKIGLNIESEVAIPIHYDGLKLDAGLRLDLLVDNVLIIELKAVDSVLPIHKAQLLTYLKMTEKRLGLLINFNVRLLKDGITRIVL